MPITARAGSPLERQACFQYVLVAFIPLSVLQMASEKIFPEHHDDKGNVELVMEILGQSIFIIMGIFFVKFWVFPGPEILVPGPETSEGTWE